MKLSRERLSHLLEVPPLVCGGDSGQSSCRVCAPPRKTLLLPYVSPWGQPSPLTGLLMGVPFPTYSTPNPYHPHLQTQLSLGEVEAKDGGEVSSIYGLTAISV